MHSRSSHRSTLAAATILLLILVLELTLSIRGQSLTWDEGDHIFAGYQAWKTADFGINPEHPPFVKELAAIPLLFMHLKTPPRKNLPFFKDEAYFDGRDLIFDNGGEPAADKIIFRARIAAAILTLLMASLVFLAGWEMFGSTAALFALALIVFEPNMIAHGAYVTTDMGISCFMFAAVYMLYRYLQSPAWPRLFALGLATGLALASKHSALLLLPIGFALALAEISWPQSKASRRYIATRLGAALPASLLLGIAVLWATYGFRFSAHPGGAHMSPSLAEYIKPLHGLEPRLYLLLEKARLLPESYLYGLADVRIVSDSFSTYIFGKVHAHGVPYYFPAAFIIKSTAGFMLLIVLVVVAVLTGSLRDRRKIAFLTLPPLIYLLVAIGTGLNIGARHILPMYPFLAVLIAGAVVALARRWRPVAYLAAALLAWHIVSSARSCPVYLAYSNEFWGGPENTYKYLTDSNVDWGQQLKAVKQYLDRRGVRDCWFGYFVEPSIHFSAYGIPCKPLPTADSVWTHYQVDTPRTITGPVLISAGTLTGYEFGSVVLSPYRQFLPLKPTAVIQHGVFVFDGAFDMRFAEALGHVTRAIDLTAAHNLEAALEEARRAVAIDPDQFQAQVALGDALVALGRKEEATPAYNKALLIAQTMEPSARQDWIPQIAAKLR